MAQGSRKTPEDRAEAVERAQRKAKKSYKTNLKRKTSVTDDELVVITDMLVSLKLVGYSNSQMGAIVGLSTGQTRVITSDPKFQSRLKSLREKLPQAAITLGQAYLVESVQAVMHVLRTESDNALVLKAAAEMFDRFGIPKLTKSEVKNETSPPVPTDLTGDAMTKLREASPEKQEAIAALHESFAEGVNRILSEGENDGD